MKKYFAVENQIALHSEDFLPPLFKTLQDFLLHVLLLEHDIVSNYDFI